jgi:DNA polymerase I-like protein with 3'-5' exonuclease and polymerase domains
MSYGAQQQQAQQQLLLQIHDEMLFVVRSSKLEEVATLVQTTMEGCCAAEGLWDLSVTLPVKLQTGPSWGQLKEFQLEV